MARTVFAVFESVYSAERAVRELLALGFPRERIDLFADSEQDNLNGMAMPEEVRTEIAIDRFQAGAAIGAGIGGSLSITSGLLVWVGALHLPLFRSPFTGEIQVAALFLFLVGISALTGGLVSRLVGLGIPEEEIRWYAKNVHKGNVTLMIVADWDAVDGTLEVLGHHNPLEIKQRSIALQRAESNDKRVAKNARKTKITKQDRPR